MAGDVIQIHSRLVNQTAAPSPERLHRTLAAFNAERLSPRAPTGNWRRELLDDLNHRVLEAQFLEDELSAFEDFSDYVPRGAALFLSWFEELEQSGPGQGDPLMSWLAESASLEEMAWFLQQELASEVGFDAWAALTQMRFPVRAKFGLTRNYWDELGQGDGRGMHAAMLARLAQALNLTPRIETTVTEALALNNAMLALASEGRHAYQSIGALGATALTAPSRARLIAQGLARLGVAPRDRHYFDMQAALGPQRSVGWRIEVIAPLVAADPTCAPFIAAGALFRLTCGARCLERYQQHFQQSAEERRRNRLQLEIVH